MQFIIRAYSPGDEVKINEMFNDVFCQNRDIAHWYWKYRDNPYGSYRISLATTEDGVLAAHYAGYPVRFSSYFPGKPCTEINTYQLGDKMTRKAFRAAGFGKGSLIAKTYEHFKDTYMHKTFPFAYGFAAHHSLRFGMLILGYADIEPVPYRKMDVAGLHNLSINRIRKFTSRLRVDAVPDIDDRWSDFFDEAAPYYTYLLKRDPAYLTWRYLKRPDRKYMILAVRKGTRLAGWSVFYRDANKIIWGDALFVPGDLNAVKSILMFLRGHPYAEGAELIECWFPPRPEWWDIILKTLGFRTEKEPNGLHLTTPILTSEETPEILKKNFYYTIGDSDLF